jgi:hypothetical protein
MWRETKGVEDPAGHQSHGQDYSPSSRAYPQQGFIEPSREPQSKFTELEQGLERLE